MSDGQPLVVDREELDRRRSNQLLERPLTREPSV